MSIERAILTAGMLLFGAIIATQMAGKLKIPALLLFLLLGMLAGSEGLGGISFDNPALARNIGTAALTVILFTGGLNSEWRSMRPVLAPGVVLSTFGVGITTILLAVFAKFALGDYAKFDFGTVGLGWREALLLAAIVSSTDAAAVFSLYRNSRVRPQSRIRALLELESGSNDPMAILLTLTILESIVGQGSTPGMLLWGLARQVTLGLVVGLLVGGLGTLPVNRRRLSFSELYPMLVLGVGLLAFGLADWVGGNGFLAVYVAGITVGNRIHNNRSEILHFHEGLAWLMEITLFVMLGLLVYPSQLAPVAIVASALAFFLMLVARPLAVLLCLLPFRRPLNQSGYVAWVGLRGAVPIVLATFPASYHLKHSEVLFHVVFFVVLLSILVQGSTLIPLTSLLRVQAPSDKS